MNLDYICIWAKNKEQTWSGTSYSLYKALSQIMNVNDKGFMLSKTEKFLIKISSILFNNHVNILSTIIPRLHLQFRKRESENIQLQIGDISESHSDYYIYQDLSIDSLIELKEKDVESFAFSNYQSVSEKKLYKRNSYQKKIYDNSSGIFTMSKWLADSLIYFSGIDKNKVHHVGGGINIDPSKIANYSKSNNKILFVGRDFQRKAGYQVYEAFKILLEKYDKNAELYIVGPSVNPFKDAVENVKFVGDIPSDELVKYFNMCDIFCMPSYFEAYGLVFIEALAFGLPVFGRNKFAMKEFIDDGYNGYLIEEDNYDEWALKIFDLLNNQKIKENVKSQQEKYIHDYSWDTVAGRIKKIIDEDHKNNL